MSKHPGFGSRWWAQQVQDVLPTDALFTGDEELDKIEPVVARLIAAVRYDEARACAKAPHAVDARIRLHKNAARRKQA